MSCTFCLKDTTPEQLVRLNEGLALAQRRLIFEELFLRLGLCVGVGRLRQTMRRCARPTTPHLRHWAALPFSPTRAQERTIAEIRTDLARPHPMQWLLRRRQVRKNAGRVCGVRADDGKRSSSCGDGSDGNFGRTALQDAAGVGPGDGTKAGAADCDNAENCAQIDAGQLQAGRFAEVWRIAETTGQVLDRESILVCSRRGFSTWSSGRTLIADAVEFKDLALVVIDEQHRFGVGQRRAPSQRPSAHILVMTATPIPRTLALTLYGDLDVSQLDELPPGRTPPTTKVLPGRAGEKKRCWRCAKAVSEGRQAYWVCPLIEDSDKLELSSATARHAALCSSLPDLRVGLVHGRLGSDERDDVMDRFRRRELDVLVATTVIEVGVDVPNASLMVIESAERFGPNFISFGVASVVAPGPACLFLHGSGLGEESGTVLSAELVDDDDEERSRGGGARRLDEKTETQTSVPSASRLEVVSATSDGFRLAGSRLADSWTRRGAWNPSVWPAAASICRPVA